MFFVLLSEAAEKYFSKMIQNKSNTQALKETLDIEKLREFVVEHLTKIENEGMLWWQDKEMLQVFERLYKAGVIFLPSDTQERVRWIALVCVGISKFEGFSYGNVLISADFVPDNELEELEDEYGVSVIEDVISFRKKVSEDGWESLVG